MLSPPVVRMFVRTAASALPCPQRIVTPPPFRLIQAVNLDIRSVRSPAVAYFAAAKGKGEAEAKSPNAGSANSSAAPALRRTASWGEVGGVTTQWAPPASESEHVCTDLRGALSKAIENLTFEDKYRLLGVSPRDSGLWFSAGTDGAVIQMRTPVGACPRPGRACRAARPRRCFRTIGGPG